MAKLPEPPSHLAVAIVPATVAAGTTLFRIYFAGGAHPASWNTLRHHGPTHARFDHHAPPPSTQARGILYAAQSPVTCIAEVFQATRVIDRASAGPRLAAFQLARDVLLLDLMGVWPTRAGASMAIGTGPRPRAQRWSRVIYSSYPSIEGLLYASSMHANQPSVAVYERAASALPSVPVFDRSLSDPVLLPRLNWAAMQLNYGLV